MKHSAIIAILGLVFVMGSSSAFSQAPPTSAPPAWETSKVLPIEKVGPGVFRIGEIQIHKRARSVTFPEIGSSSFFRTMPSDSLLLA